MLIENVEDALRVEHRRHQSNRRAEETNELTLITDAKRCSGVIANCCRIWERSTSSAISQEITSRRPHALKMASSVLNLGSS